MKKIVIFLGLFAATAAIAAVTVNTQPTSLVTSATTLAAETEKAVFEFALTADAAETLSSVTVTVNSPGATTTDLANVSVYSDDGDGSFDTGDLLAGTNTTVNVGSITTVNTEDNNTLTGGKFFVTVKTSATWSGTDSITLNMGASSIMTSSNSPAVTAVTTAALNAPVVDTTGPVLQTAVAKNTGGTSAKEANDSVDLTFNEATNKPVINAANIDSVLVLTAPHSWLDGAGSIGAAMWNEAGTVLTVKISAGTTLPNVAVGDTVTIAGTVIKDSANNNATGTVTITGSFLETVGGGGEEEEHGKNCGQGIINGRLYKIGSEETVYLAAACRLKPFRGAAVFHARGHKFQNIIVLSSAPSVTPVTTEPALPAGGTLVQGTDPTVWFVTIKGKKKGFVSENSFKRLGFSFKSVKKISDSDLGTMSSDTPITETAEHPEGSIIKCGTSATVFEVKGNKRFPFTSIDAFEGRGHSFEHIALVDCGRFAYPEGTNLQ
jgi:hypothetical protein